MTLNQKQAKPINTPTMLLSRNISLMRCVFLSCAASLWAQHLKKGDDFTLLGSKILRKRPQEELEVTEMKTERLGEMQKKIHF